MEDHEILDQFLEHRQQNFVIDNMNAVAGCGGIGVADVVGSGGEILGVKYDEQLQAEEHDVGDDDELKYVKEVQQSEKQQTGGKDFGDYNSGNELAENEEATQQYKIGHGDVAAVDMKDEKEIANVVSTNSNDEHNGINKTEELQQQVMENINNNPQNTNSPLSFEKSEEEEVEENKKYSANGGDEEDISSLASNGTSSLSENVAQQFANGMENAKEFGFSDGMETKELSTPLGDMDIQLQPNVNIEGTHCPLNPDAKEFVPNFGSNPASPLSPHPNDIMSSNFDSNDFFGQAPSAVPRRLMDDDDFVAHSPRKGRCGDMDVISLPAEQEFDEEADRRPHELTQDEVVLSDNNMQFDMPNTEVVSSEPILDMNEDQGPETSVDPDEDMAKEQAFEKISLVENDVMKQSIYMASDEPIEDVLNSVQPIPTEIDSVNNSFMDDFTVEKDFVGEKEQLQTEEKEHISNSPSTEEMQVELENAPPSNSGTFDNLMYAEGQMIKDTNESVGDVQKEELLCPTEVSHEQPLPSTLGGSIDQPCSEIIDDFIQGDVDTLSNPSHVDEKHLMEETKETPISIVQENCDLEDQMGKMSLNADDECMQMDETSPAATVTEDITKPAEHLLLETEYKPLENSEDLLSNIQETSIDENEMVANEVSCDKISSNIFTGPSEINELEKLESVDKCENQPSLEPLSVCEVIQSPNEDLINSKPSDTDNVPEVLEPLSSAQGTEQAQNENQTLEDTSNVSHMDTPSEEKVEDLLDLENPLKSELEVSTPDDNQSHEEISHEIHMDTPSEEKSKDTAEQTSQETTNLINDESSEVHVSTNDTMMELVNNSLDAKSEIEQSNSGAVDAIHENSNPFENTMENEKLMCDNSIVSHTLESTVNDINGSHPKPEEGIQQISEEQTVVATTTTEESEPEKSSNEAADVVPVVSSIVDKIPLASTATKADDAKKPISKATAGATKSKPPSATAPLTKKSTTLKSATGVAAKPRVAPTKPSSAATVGDKKPIKMATTGVAGPRKTATTSGTSTTKTTTKNISGTSTVRSVPSATNAKTLTSKPTTTTRTTASTSSTTRKPLSSNATTTSTTKPRPASGNTLAATKPTTLGVPAANAAAKPKVTSPRATLTSQLRKTAPGATTAGAKSPTKNTTTSSSVTKTTSSSVGSRTKTTTSTTTVTTTTKQFTARPAPKTTSSAVGSTSTTNRRLTVGGTANVSTTTQASSKTTTSATQRKSSPTKPVAGKTPTKSSATSSIGAKTTMKPITKSNTQKTTEHKLNTQTKPVAGEKELNGNASPINDAPIEPQQPTSENGEQIVPNTSELLIPSEGDGNTEQPMQVEMSSA